MHCRLISWLTDCLIQNIHVVDWFLDWVLWILWDSALNCSSGFQLQLSAFTFWCLLCLASAALLQINICFCRGINDKHIWISVVGRPPLSTFSRTQRVACCLSLILGYLLTNMMFFQVQTTEEQRNMKLGVFTFNWAQFAIGIFQFQHPLQSKLNFFALHKNVVSQPIFQAIFHELVECSPCSAHECSRVLTSVCVRVFPEMVAV